MKSRRDVAQKRRASFRSWRVVNVNSLYNAESPGAWSEPSQISRLRVEFQVAAKTTRGSLSVVENERNLSTKMLRLCHNSVAFAQEIWLFHSTKTLVYHAENLNSNRLSRRSTFIRFLKLFSFFLFYSTSLIVQSFLWANLLENASLFCNSFCAVIVR